MIGLLTANCNSQEGEPVFHQLTSFKVHLSDVLVVKNDHKDVDGTKVQEKTYKTN